MVKRIILSKYQQDPPDGLSAESDTRIISTDKKLYPEMLDILENCSVIPVNQRTLDTMQIHRLDASDLRKWVIAALTTGEFINSQWCRGGKPQGLYACDAYVVTGLLYKPSEKKDVETRVYIKMCITKTGATTAIMSLHPSYSLTERN